MNEGLLKDFLNSLGNNYPVKLKEILIKIDQTVKGDILNTTNNFYLTYLAEISFELTVSIVRDMALYQPSKFVAAIFGKFLQTYRDHKNYNVLKTHVFRSLNLMLIRTPTKELNDHFKSYLPKLIHDHVSV